jgi:aryl-phospho-beta-D-glucosidase BglC (GH1 family)
MKKTLVYLFALLLVACNVGKQNETNGFVTISGHDLIKPDGEKLFIQGTNLGNWLNPEGYMFGFSRTNSAWMIDLLFKEAVGPDKTALFWQQFKDNYVTRADIDYIARQGANTIRLPFNYKLFTDDDYMGQTGQKDGYERIDSIVSWCKANQLYLILDMHDCPEGQTGDNIDDGYGYPWLFESESAQQLFCSIWRDIASRYKNETTILGYELMNEPIAHYFDNRDSLYQLLQPLYQRCVKAIREVDQNHIILLGGAHWNSFFWMLDDVSYDDKLMFTCHRYGGPATKEAIAHYIHFRDSVNRPMYMGEFGHNTDEWQRDFVRILKKANIGYTFWPYKKVDGSCMMAIQRPEGWDSIVVNYSETSRNTYQEWREARPKQQTFRQLLDEFARNCRFDRCTPQKDYIQTMGFEESKKVIRE